MAATDFFLSDNPQPPPSAFSPALDVARDLNFIQEGERGIKVRRIPPEQSEPGVGQRAFFAKRSGSGAGRAAGIYITTVALAGRADRILLPLVVS